MDSSDKITGAVIVALLVVLLAILIGAMRKDTQNQECRLTAMTFGMPSAEILQLCK